MKTINTGRGGISQTFMCADLIQQTDELTSSTSHSCPPDKLSDLKNMP